MNCKELADYLQVHVVTIYRWLKRPEITGIPGKKINGQWSFHKEHIEHWLNERCKVKICES